jgi:hypothetical protein
VSPPLLTGAPALLVRFPTALVCFVFLLLFPLRFRRGEQFNDLGAQTGQRLLACVGVCCLQESAAHRVIERASLARGLLALRKLLFQLLDDFHPLVSAGS